MDIEISHVNTSSKHFFCLFGFCDDQQILTLHNWTKPRKHIQQNENLQKKLFYFGKTQLQILEYEESCGIMILARFLSLVK